MNHNEFEQESRRKLRALKVWKRVIIVHGVLLFLMAYNFLIMVFLQPGSFADLPRYFINFIEDFINYPIMLISYALISLSLNLFTIPRLIALYRFIEAIVLGERKLKHVLFYILCVLLQFVIIVLGLSTFLAKAHKPVIYLYPGTRTEVNVKLELDGKLTATYPSYNAEEGWTITADPDGTLTDKKGRQYSYLYWEGDIKIKPDLSHGYCVKGEDTARFLEKALRQMGLSDKEADDFITYWLPEMEGNRYNVITFQTKAYEDVASLYVSPKPDTVIRVNMLWYPSNKYVEIKPQDLASINPTDRKGFTVVEWGGEKYRKNVFGALTEVR